MLENNINDPILNLEINTTSQLLKSILKKHQTDYVSVGDLLESFNTGGFFLKQCLKRPVCHRSSYRTHEAFPAYMVFL